MSRFGQRGFVLVHGAWHDAGAWDPLREILDCEGYRSVAVDLPSDNVDVDAPPGAWPSRPSRNVATSAPSRRLLAASFAPARV